MGILPGNYCREHGTNNCPSCREANLNSYGWDTSAYIKVRQSNPRIKELEKENKELKKRVEELEATINRIAANPSGSWD